MGDPAMAAARDEAQRLGTIVGSDVDRVENELLREVAAGECHSCGDPDYPAGECPKSQRPCGHHCNHIGSHDHCHWCGFEEVES